MIVSDDEFVKIGGVLLPGIFKSIDISGSAILEELEVEGKGKKPKQAIGYEDHKISIDLILLDDIEGKTREEKLTVIQNLFRKKGQKIPEVYDIVNRHTAQRGIDRVIFKDMSTKESNSKEEISVSLDFVEYEPITVSVTSKKSGTASGVSTNSSIAIGLGTPYQNYLLNRGDAPTLTNQVTNPTITNFYNNIDYMNVLGNEMGKLINSKPPKTTDKTVKSPANTLPNARRE